MTAKELAERLNDREIGEEINLNECKTAKDNGLVVLFGASDDLAEFRGAIDDETGCYDGGNLFVHRGGVLGEHEHCECDFCGYMEQKKKCAKIEAVWCGEEGYSWTYKTSIPHASFNINEGSERYCRGIVFNLSDLPQ